jgi:hypothetical protein
MFTSPCINFSYYALILYMTLLPDPRLVDLVDFATDILEFSFIGEKLDLLYFSAISAIFCWDILATLLTANMLSWLFFFVKSNFLAVLIVLGLSI